MNEPIRLEDSPNTCCIKCAHSPVKYRVVTSSDEAYDDIEYSCEKCGYSWWIAGSDY